jgi:phosphoribosylanthranilate isomerase
MRVRIKICCISSFSEALTTIETGADAIGLVARMPGGPELIHFSKQYQVHLAKISTFAG